MKYIMFQWRGQMLYFIFLCNKKRKVVATDVTLAASRWKHWFDEEKTKQIFNEELEATSTIPLAHYTTITFNRSLHYGVGGCVHLCMCFGLHWCFKLESCKIHPATESQSKLYHERSYLTLYNSEQAWEANHWGCFETNGFLPNGKCSH